MASTAAHPSPSPRRKQPIVGNGAAVRVILRVRPFLASELSSPSSPHCCASLLDNHEDSCEAVVHLKDSITSRNECFRLDGFYGQEDHVRRIFSDEVSKVIPGVFNGTNATVFAYGATGSGKTYTMQGTEAEPGVGPLAVAAVLALAAGTGCSVDVAYYQIYLERCYDLLELKEKEIAVLDDKDGNAQLKGLTWVPVCSMEEFGEIYSRGTQRRKVARTHLNDVSSRSHAVLSIVVKNGAVKGKLNLIDMAGNEDNRRTCNEGIRMQESTKINQSLFALSNVISALNNKDSWIPYRESKLTRVLQDSLGGTSQALMIACINPVAYQESLYTVSLAARSRHVVNNVSAHVTPREKVDMNAKLRSWLESKGKTKSIQRLDGLLSPTRLKSPNTSSHAKLPGSARSAINLQSKHVERKKDTKKKLFDIENHGSQSMEENSKTAEVTAEDAYTCTKTESEDAVLAVDSNACVNAVSGELTSHHIQSDAQLGSDNLRLPQSFIESGTPVKDQNSETGPQLESSTCQRSQMSLRKALSPISSSKMNIPFFWDAQSPAVAIRSDENEASATPLDKFSAKSCTLKDSFISNYLEFLNIANKEELMQLKGIGQKRAEYILELREDCPAPFKSLSDLEMIGLSEKQVNDMFRRAARGIFT